MATDTTDGAGDAVANDPHGARVRRLHRRLERDRSAFDPPADPPAESEALRYLREGVGQAVLVYVDAHVEGHDRFTSETFDALEETMNGYLELYAACYGRSIDASCSIRTAAELLIETRDITDVAVLLTRVPADG